MKLLSMLRRLRPAPVEGFLSTPATNSGGAEPVIPTAQVGFGGKLPSRGDYVERGLPQSFLKPWHAWMDTSLAATRASEGEVWRSKWLETPIWNFILAGGICGPDAALGLWLPSVDAVSRHYPLTVAAVFDGQTQSSWDESGLAWLRVVEPLASEAVSRCVTPEALIGAIEAVPNCKLSAALSGSWWWINGPSGEPTVCLQLDTLPSPRTFAAMLGRQLVDARLPDATKAARSTISGLD